MPRSGEIYSTTVVITPGIMLFPRLFKQSVARTPDRVAVVNLGTNETFTYRELAEAVYSVANGLEERGIEPGDRLTICMGNRPEHVITFLATQLIGAVAVPFNFRVSADGVTYHVNNSKSKLLLYDTFSKDAVETAAGDLDVPLIYVGDDPADRGTSFESLLDVSSTEPPIQVTEDDPSVMLYSSGTTGDPKGIPLDHRATTARTLVNAMGQRYYLGETILGVMPLYHTVGLHGVLCDVLGMSGTYLCQPQLDPEQCVRAIPEWDVTALHEAPTIFHQYLKTDTIEEVDLSSVSAVGFSGAPMSSSVFEAVIDVFEPDHVANLYGTTEAYGTLAYEALEKGDDPTTAGPANVFFETRIVDVSAIDPDATVDPGIEGELIVNTESPVAFDGYWNKPEQTEAVIQDGWFFTGDAAYETDERNIVITGRSDDMIISGGENIHPANVEDVLASHPKIADVGIVGVPDEEWGEKVKAYIVSDGLSANKLDQWCLENDELPNFKRPRVYEFVSELPRNPSGKIMRYKLQNQE